MKSLKIELTAAFHPYLVKCEINIDEKGNVTSQYPIGRKRDNLRITLTREEFFSATGKEYYNKDVEIIGMPISYREYQLILDKSAAASCDPFENLTDKDAEKEKTEVREKSMVASARKRMTADEEREMIGCKLFDAEDAEERSYLGLDALDGLDY